MQQLRAGVMILFVLTTGAALPATASIDLERARLARDRAEKAIAEERWCDAAHDLMRVYRHSDRPEALYNAAIAAQRADDKVLALSLFDRFVHRAALSPQRPDALDRAGVLRGQIAAGHSGISCHPLDPDTEIDPRASAAATRPEVVEERIPADAPVADPRVEASSPTETATHQPPPEPEPQPAPPPAGQEEAVALPSPAEEPDPARPETPTMDPAAAARLLPPGNGLALVPEPPGPAQPPRTRGGALKPAGWVMLGLGSALVGTGGGFTWSAAQQKDLLERNIGLDPLRPFDQEMRRAEQDFELHRDVGLAGMAGGGLLTTVGLVLLLIAGGMAQ